MEVVNEFFGNLSKELESIHCVFNYDKINLSVNLVAKSVSYKLGKKYPERVMIKSKACA